MTHLTPAEALQEIQRTLREKTDLVPEGFFTVKQLAAQWDKSIAQTSKLVTKAMDDGLAEMGLFKVCVGYTSRSTPHYRFVKKK
jgi:hypothetical protein